MEIDLNKLKTVKKQLDALESDEVAFLCEEGSQKYAVLPISLYEKIEDILELAKQPQDATNVRVVNANALELSYEEYESVKKQIMDAFDKTFKPKPEKLN